MSFICQSSFNEIIIVHVYDINIYIYCALSSYHTNKVHTLFAIFNIILCLLEQLLSLRETAHKRNIRTKHMCCINGCMQSAMCIYWSIRACVTGRARIKVQLVA